MQLTSFTDILDAAYCKNCDMHFKDPIFWKWHRLEDNRELYCRNIKTTQPPNLATKVFIEDICEKCGAKK